jgi:cyclophilin family peptidyl-prolyl cis-trans isomerase
MYIQGGDLSKVFSKLIHRSKINSNIFSFLFTAKYKDGFSVYDGEFADESFQVKHTEPGLLGMCKRSSVQHTNECQFYVTLGAPLSFMDGQTVIFGRVIEGFRVFKLIEKMDTTNERPHPPV